MRILLFLLNFLFITSFQIKYYNCNNNKCQLKTKTNQKEQIQNEDLSLSHCLLICGEGQIWPYPSNKPIINNQIKQINIKKDKLNILYLKNNEKLNQLFEIYFETFYNSINNLIPKQHTQNNKDNKDSKNKDNKNNDYYELQINLQIENINEINLSLTTDESYSITTNVINENKIVQVNIQSKNYFGARHGLETLSQLIVWDDLLSSLIIASDVQINDDQPSFKYRGVMLDLSRHFLPIEVIERTIRSMSYNKLNVLHLHLSDTASFPLQVNNQPNLTDYGAYSEFEIYTHEQIQYLFNYATSHGVIILPEIDTPAHVSAGWQWGDDTTIGPLTLCSDPNGYGGDQWLTDSLEPPSGQLNLANSNIYPILKDIYSDIIKKFASSSGIIHLGGDEVIVGSDEDWAACYNSSTLGEPIITMIENLGLSRNDPESFYLVWQNFTKIITQLSLDSFQELSPQITPKFHFWGGAGESTVTYNLINRPDVTDTLPPNLFTIQVWDDSSDSITKRLIKKGYNIILSNTDYVYLDCGNAGPTNPGGYWCQPYHEWYHIYNYINDIVNKWELSNEQLQKVITIIIISYLFYF